MNPLHTLGLLAALLAPAAASGASPHLKVYPLSPDNTLVRVDSPQRYLTLPVQESMPDSRVDILVDGDLRHTIYVRLADNNVDYTVPLDLAPFTTQGSVALNITSEADRTHSRNASEFICWDHMATTDTFDITNREKYRPAYHHTPLYGWMNDPNGMFYENGRWHLYYQYNPYGSKWQNMTWGHSTSTDLAHWEHHPAAIIPNGLGTIFSGSAAIDSAGTAGFGPGAVVALYTSAGRSQVQSLAYSTDQGQTFRVYPGNPVIPNPSEARDPNFFWHAPTSQWVLVLAHALEKEIQFYTSPNLIDWTLRSSFGKGYGAQDGVWECPDLFEATVGDTGQKKWVLIVNINPGSPMGGSGTQYFIGDFDGTTFTPDDDPATQKWLDYGKDHYATVTWSDAPDGRRTAIGWMSNWQYANDVPTLQYRSANTLPRELSLFSDPEGHLRVASTPSPELSGLRTACKSYSRRTVGARPLTVAIPPQAEIDIDYDASQSSLLAITLANDAGEEAILTIDPAARTATFDRTRAGLSDFSSFFPAVTTAPTFRDSAKGSLRIFIDNCSVEVFDSEGRFVLTNLVFPTQPYRRMTVAASGGPARIGHIDVYTLDNTQN